jgi:hypothetical protein
MAKKAKGAKQDKCAFMNAETGVCRILTENVCEYKRCSFFKSIVEYEKCKNRDFLYESYLKGDISRWRYIELCKTYPSCKRTKL